MTATYAEPKPITAAELAALIDAATTDADLDAVRWLIVHHQDPVHGIGALARRYAARRSAIRVAAATAAAAAGAGVAW